MQGGRLAMPGVETRPAKETQVTRRDLGAFEGRLFSDLAGDADFLTISAAPILSEGLHFPLRDEEAELRRRMVSTEPRSPLGRYACHSNARWNRTMTTTRRFRRSETAEMLLCLVGDRLETARWYVDLAPGTKESRLREAGENLQIVDPGVSALFEDLTSSAWMDLSRGERDIGSDDIKSLISVSLQMYENDTSPSVVYHPFIGIVRGSPGDVFEAFGKSSKEQ